MVQERVNEIPNVTVPIHNLASRLFAWKSSNSVTRHVLDRQYTTARFKFLVIHDRSLSILLSLVVFCCTAGASLAGLVLADAANKLGAEKNSKKSWINAVSYF